MHSKHEFGTRRESTSVELEATGAFGKTSFNLGAS